MQNPVSFQNVNSAANALLQLHSLEWFNIIFGVIKWINQKAFSSLFEEGKLPELNGSRAKNERKRGGEKAFIGKEIVHNSTTHTEMKSIGWMQKRMDDATNASVCNIYLYKQIAYFYQGRET